MPREVISKAILLIQDFITYSSYLGSPTHFYKSDENTIKVVKALGYK